MMLIQLSKLCQTPWFKMGEKHVLLHVCMENKMLKAADERWQAVDLSVT